MFDILCSKFFLHLNDGSLRFNELSRMLGCARRIKGSETFKYQAKELQTYQPSFPQKRVML